MLRTTLQGVHSYNNSSENDSDRIELDHRV